MDQGGTGEGEGGVGQGGKQGKIISIGKREMGSDERGDNRPNI